MASQDFTPIENLDFYILFDQVSDWCWDEVVVWPVFAQKAFGDQLIRAADSILANLVEGDGRHSSKDSLHFFIIARASAREARMWLKKVSRRKLAPPDEVESQLAKLTQAAKLLNMLIRYRRGQIKQGAKTQVVKEESSPYDYDPFVAKD